MRFTEERIKQQCEQENYENEQNSASGANDTAYQNEVGISNTNNASHNTVGYSCESETNPNANPSYHNEVGISNNNNSAHNTAGYSCDPEPNPIPNPAYQNEVDISNTNNTSRNTVGFSCDPEANPNTNPTYQNEVDISNTNNSSRNSVGYACDPEANPNPAYQNEVDISNTNNSSHNTVGYSCDPEVNPNTNPSYQNEVDISNTNNSSRNTVGYSCDPEPNASYQNELDISNTNNSTHNTAGYTCDPETNPNPAYQNEVDIANTNNSSHNAAAYSCDPETNQNPVYPNEMGISNTNNSSRNIAGYSCDPETNPHGAGDGPEPPPPAPDNNLSNNFMMSSLVGTQNQNEKKKRGRPKKVKGQEVIDPVTGKKIQMDSPSMGCNNGDYANILNLSVGQGPNSEKPKKKRNRPKKVKPEATSKLSHKPNSMPNQSLSSDMTQGSPHQMQGLLTNHQHASLYSTPPPYQGSIYSPMASPSLNCSYTTNTPPFQPHHDKLGSNMKGRETAKATASDLGQPSHHPHQHPMEDQHFGESPPPSSPNFCNVDFEPPTASTASSSMVSDNVNPDLNAIHQRLHSNSHRSRFNSPISGEVTPDRNANEHFQQWLSPQQQPSLNYHDQPQQQGVADNNPSNNFMMSSLVGTQHEKKKRGRPKKIKGQEIIDPVTGNKIQVNSQMMGSNSGEYAGQVSNSEMPKKKRGRPKKVKPPSTSKLGHKPNIMSIQSLTSDITQGSPHQMPGLLTNHQHAALYSTPPPYQGSIYSPMASPMTSPSLNCSYTTNTPPFQPHHDKLGLNINGRESSKATAADLVPPSHHQHQHPIEDQHFGESPPPSSPNICNVDFEPPTASTAASSIVSENVNSDMNAIHQRLHSNNQRSPFNSPISGEVTPDHNANEHFQQWLSPQPNHNIHSPVAATSTMFVDSPQQSSLNYHHQTQQQMQAIQQQQQQPQHQEIHPQWALRHQSRYDDQYLLSSQLHQTHSHNHANHPSQHGVSDVARKSLSGLESLVDQIPTISESESMNLSSAAVNAQVAAAAAVESRLQAMQNSSLADTQVQDDSHFSSIAGPQNILTASNSPSSASINNNQIQQSNTTSNLLNSNFSVSNLAASSASNNNNSNNNNNNEIYGPATNTNAYHHSNLMAAAVLAAAAANSPTNLSPSTAAAGTTNHHASMYMDPHAHLTTHVPVNSIYPTAAPPTHHHHHSAVAAHHHAAAHYGSAQHSASDYATPHNPYAVTQGGVTTSHTLHMPSPNYPYGYPTASSQSNYSAYHPHSHHVNHHHGHPHAHHLAMFDRLKPSDLTGYSSGF